LSAIFSSQLGLDVTVLSARSAARPTYEFPTGTKIEFASKEAKGLLAYIRMLLSMRHRRFQYAFGFWSQDNILLALALLGSGTKVVLCEHAPHELASWGVRVLRRLIYPLAELVTVLNTNDLAYYRKFLKRVALVPNPVPAAPPARPLREKLIIAIGHLVPLKGFEDFLRAVRTTQLPAHGWRFAIIGDGPELERLRCLARALGLNVEFVPQTCSIHEWYSRATMIAITSRVESFSLVLAEAVAAGVVPAAYATSGPADLLESFPELLAPAGDYRRLGEILTNLAEAGDLSDRRASLRKSFETRFSPDTVGEQWRALLRGGSRPVAPVQCGKQIT
jgi:GalNAc-alpha-(1->4)-GalNAc-alpha-(1->3)-diNAcBac-PP-undecaprenol alpha-1,4-N-acetyl-D-galactosaminyltransferase